MMIVIALLSVNAAKELRPDAMSDRPQSRARGRVVEHSYSARCVAWAHAVRSVSEESRDCAEHARAAAQCAGCGGLARNPGLKRTAPPGGKRTDPPRAGLFVSPI